MHHSTLYSLLLAGGLSVVGVAPSFAAAPADNTTTEQTVDGHILMTFAYSNKFFKQGDELQANFQLLATRAIPDYELTLYLDDEPVRTYTASDFQQLIANDQVVFSVSYKPQTALAVGTHTLKLEQTKEGGSPVAAGKSLSTLVRVYDQTLAKQKYLMEHFTETWCTYCPPIIRGMENLMHFYSDKVAWLGIHQESDVFYTTEQGEFGKFNPAKSYPSVFTDRHAIVSPYGYTARAMPYRYSDTFDKSVADDFLQETLVRYAYPAFANLDVKSDYDEATRNLTVTVDMTAVDNFEQVFGPATLSVCLVEDGLEAYQTNMGTVKHNAVFRKYLTASAAGDPILWNGTTATKSYTYVIPENNVAANMKVVAFISKDLSSGTYTSDERFVTNAEEVPVVSDTPTGIHALRQASHGGETGYDLSGRRVPASAKGLVIVHKDGKSVKVFK